LLFRSIVLDVDSTLCGIEGVDWLAARRGEEIARLCAETTDRAMNGEIPIEAVYGQRLDLVRPTRGDVEALADAYRTTLALGAAESIRSLRGRGVALVLVSGGLRPAILPLALDLGFAPDELHAVDVRWDANGAYAGFDTTSPLATQAGKLRVVRGLGLPRPTLAVGDGSTDVGMRDAVDAFAAFTGFVRRDTVIAAADVECASFRDLLEIAMKPA